MIILATAPSPLDHPEVTRLLQQVILADGGVFTARIAQNPPLPGKNLAGWSLSAPHPLAFDVPGGRGAEPARPPLCRRFARLVSPPARLPWQSPACRRACLPRLARPYLDATLNAVGPCRPPSLGVRRFWTRHAHPAWQDVWHLSALASCLCATLMLVRRAGGLGDGPE